jgi:hypothetical protein
MTAPDVIANNPFAKGLRIEAQPMNFAHFSWSQVEAAKQIARALLGAYNQSNEELEGGNQRNQILMISGGKGAGKTTLVLSLRQWYMDLHSLKHDTTALKEAHLVHETPAAKQYEQYGKDIHTLIQECKNKVIWLDTLSLDPLHRGTNLVAAIFARITHAMARNNDRDQLNRGILDPVSATDRAFHELGSLKSDAVLALEGNLESRAAGMDTESYAIAATESERKKQETATRLNKVLRRLLEGSKVNKELSKGLFVLPIDDMDSCPERAVEMLKLAYSLSVPRLAFVFLGSIDVTDQILFYQIQGQFQNLLKDRDEDASHALEATANNIASSTLRKMIPPSQRIILEPLTLERAERFTPGGEKQDKTLRDLLSSLHLTSTESFFEGTPNATTERSIGEPAAQTKASGEPGEAKTIEEKKSAKPSLASLIFAKDPFSKTDSQSIRGFKDHIYDGLRILQAAPRHLADLHTLSSEENSDPKTLIQELFSKAFCTLVDEDGDLTPSVQRRLKTCLHRDPFSDDIELTPPNLKMITETGDRLSFELSRTADDAERSSLSYTVEAMRVRELELEAPIPNRNISPKLSPPTRSTFKVIHDLIRINNVGVVTEPIEHADLDKIAFTLWDDGVNEPFQVPWLSMKWKTFWHTDAFFRLWNHGLQTIRTICREKSDLKSPDLCFLLAVTAASSLTATAMARVPDESGAWMDDRLASLKPLFILQKATDDYSKWNYTHLGISKPLEEEEPAPEGTPDPNVSENETEIIKRSLVAAVADAALKLAKRAQVKQDEGEDDDEAAHINGALVNLILLGAPECGVPRVSSCDQFSHIVDRLKDNHHIESVIAPKARTVRRQRLGKHATTSLGLSFLATDLTAKSSKPTA